MTDDVADEIREEHCALLWALAILTDDIQYQSPVFRALAGRPPAVWHAVLAHAARIIADTIPRYGADDFPEGMFNRDAPPVLLTRAAAATQVREQLSALVARHGPLEHVGSDDDLDGSQLGHLDDEWRRMLDSDQGDGG